MARSKTTSVAILNLEAKDLWLSNNLITPNEKGYNIYTRVGDINYRKFDGSFDYSLDWLKLKRVFYSTYHRNNITFTHNGKNYTKSVINVNFNYSVKEFNREFYRSVESDVAVKGIRPQLYTKVGYDSSKLNITDGVCVINGELVAIVTGIHIHTSLSEEVLGGRFRYEDGQYVECQNRTVVNVADLRKWIYKNGFVCDGKRYVRYKRSNGSSRIGKCLFIDEALYPRMYKWQCCGIDPLTKPDLDLAAFEAYIGLTLSSIIGTVEIYPENILVINDYESTFTDNMIVTRVADGHLHSQVEEATVCNKIWDGQSLMDSSLFEGYEQHGMLLLRNRFFKSCCFNTNLQEWFRDNNITDVSQLQGFTLAKRIEDVKLITTPSSIKYLKFGTYKQWLRRVEPTFGIVKYEKPTHYLDGKLVSTHYQLINTLELSRQDVAELLQPTTDFLNLLNTNPAVLRHYIKYNTESNDYQYVKNKRDIIYKFLGVTDRFANTKIYDEFKTNLIKSVKSDARKGRIRVNGTYATLFGNPIEMLQYTIGKFDGKPQLGVGNIHCKNFAFNKLILGSRSPHVCASNIYLANNVYSATIERYFNLSKQIVVVNSINEPLLDRFSGSDFDSDTCMLTDNPILIRAAQKNYNKFLVPLNQVEAKKIHRDYCQDELADLDIKTSTNKIGEDINLAQILTTLFWDNIHHGQTFEDNKELYCDIVSLDILSNIEIDKAKKEFDVNTKSEIDTIRDKYSQRTCDNKPIIPKFLGYIARTKGYYDSVRKQYKYYESSMDYVEQYIVRLKFRHPNKYTPFYNLFDIQEGKVAANYGQRSLILSEIDRAKRSIKAISAAASFDRNEKSMRIDEIIRERDKKIAALRINLNTVKLLIKTMGDDKYSSYKAGLFSSLFVNKDSDFYNAIIKIKEPVSEIEPDTSGDIDLYGYKYKLL